MWGQIAGWVATTVLSYAFKPKTRTTSTISGGQVLSSTTTWSGTPAPPSAAGLSDFDVPVATDGKEIPVLFGTREITQPNVVWYGHLKTRPITETRTETGFVTEEIGEQTETITVKQKKSIF
jgi:hypothetical protein